MVVTKVMAGTWTSKDGGYDRERGIGAMAVREGKEATTTWGRAWERSPSRNNRKSNLGIVNLKNDNIF